MRYFGRSTGRRGRRWRGLAILAAGVAAIACNLVAFSGGAQAANKTTPGFSLARLISEAKAEGGTLQVWDSSSSVVTIAKNFSARYGIKVVGTKVSGTTELAKLQALKGNPNPSVTVVIFATGPELAAQLIPEGIVKSWVPPDLDIPKSYQDPLLFLYQPAVFYYDPQLFNTCPISNVWQLTTSAWRHKFAITAPTQTPNELEWFAEMVLNDKNQLAAAYQAYFHKKYTGTNAGRTFIEDLAKNAPIVETSLDTAIEAAGGPGVTKTDAAIALAHGATYGDAKTDDTHIAMCRGMDPWDGYLYPDFIVETTHAHLPYEAELFIHYAETAVGNAPASTGGGASGNVEVPPGTGGPPGEVAAEKNPADFLRLRLSSLKQDQSLEASVTKLWLENLVTP
jgi:iron(III) transport system substrate-binding protein